MLLQDDFCIAAFVADNCFENIKTSGDIGRTIPFNQVYACLQSAIVYPSNGRAISVQQLDSDIPRLRSCIFNLQSGGFLYRIGIDLECVRANHIVALIGYIFT